MSTLSGQSFLQRIEVGDITAVINLLQSSSIDVEEKDEIGQTFLMYACQLGSLTVVKELLEKGVDVNVVDNDNWSALLNAAKEGCSDIVVTLLEAGAAIDHRDMGGWTALMWACYKGHTSVVQALLDRGASPNNRGEHRVPAIIWAAGRGHTEIVRLLLNFGAKVNTCDRYGTTPLIWAARKGFCRVVDILLAEGANVDTAGMNSWTALLMACKGGYTDCVRSILEHNPNVNAMDKDGLTGLAIAAKDGHVEIVKDLLGKGAYVNVTERDNDSILIRAVRGGHYEIVQALLGKSADVDHVGAENKTALFWAVDKNDVDLVKLLLKYDPDLEVSCTDGTTVLLKAVKNRNVDLVRLLLDKGAKPSAVDKRGDNALHICLRAHHRKLAEQLLRNPKESRLLYCANGAGETPYNIDASLKKSILTQIFGARNLNAAELSENLLGYDLYSSSLADVLSEPTMHTPMTVGLFAKWGSGKSFLLSHLQAEMEAFAQSPQDIYFEFSYFIFILVLLISSIVGVTVGMFAWNWQAGLGSGIGLFMFCYLLMGTLWFIFNFKDWTWTDKISMYLGQKICSLSLLLQMLFCNQPRNAYLKQKTTGIRFLFTEKTKLTSVGGEKSIAAMIGTLSDSVEKTYGVIATRLFRAFGPSKSPQGCCSRFKGICCLPYFLIAILQLFAIIVSIGLLLKYGIHSGNVAVNSSLITLAVFTGIVFIANVYNWAQMIMALAQSQQTRILKASNQLEALKPEGFLQVLKSEVQLMVRTVKCMDSFSGHQSRLVVILDGLDSCEQEKVMRMLDMVNSLFCDADSPFITLLAVDPHIIIKGIESNLHRVFHDSSINGHDYLRNIVHLPFYLQSQGLPRPLNTESPLHDSSPQRAATRTRQDSTYSSYSGQNDLRPSKRHHHKSVAGSNNFLGSSSVSVPGAFGSMTVSRPPSVMDLSKSVIKNDYFSDVNPKSMRRLMNIVAITGRLLRAYNIDFSWYRLSAWINISEQWPYRASWILLYYHENEETIDESVTLKEIYDNVIDRIPLSKDVDPLMEIDRNPRKFEVFLTSHTPMLNVADIRKFLPCTISLDPYLRKLIKEMSHQTDQIGQEFGLCSPLATPSKEDSVRRRRISSGGDTPRMALNGSAARIQQRLQQQQQIYPGLSTHLQPIVAPPMVGPHSMVQQPYSLPYCFERQPAPFMAKMNLKIDERLSDLSVSQVCELLPKLPGLDGTKVSKYCNTFVDSNISGLVLASCDMDELKQVLGMSFGDWQLFRAAILCLRDQELDALQSSKKQSDLSNTEQSHAALVAEKLQASVEQERKPRSINRAVSSDCEVTSQLPTPRSRSSSISNSHKNIPRSTSKVEERRAMPRQDSVVQQIMMENMLLRDVMDDFTNGQSALEEESSEVMTVNQTGLDDPLDTLDDDAASDFSSGACLVGEPVVFTQSSVSETDGQSIHLEMETFAKAEEETDGISTRVVRPRDIQLDQKKTVRDSLGSIQPKTVTFEEETSSECSSDTAPLVNSREPSPLKMMIATSLEKLHHLKGHITNVVVHKSSQSDADGCSEHLLSSVGCDSVDSALSSTTAGTDASLPQSDNNVEMSELKDPHRPTERSKSRHTSRFTVTRSKEDIKDSLRSSRESGIEFSSHQGSPETGECKVDIGL